jgi:hypothetical protein
MGRLTRNQDIYSALNNSAVNTKARGFLKNAIDNTDAYEALREIGAAARRQEEKVSPIWRAIS